MKIVNGYDIDGVIYMGKDCKGLFPRPEDVIITGRSYEEAPETYAMLQDMGIHNQMVFFNPLPFNLKTRESSGRHKADVINRLWQKGVSVDHFYEDDPIQAEAMRENVRQLGFNVIEVVHDLVEKENVRHEW